jgi:hypothetical protein
VFFKGASLQTRSHLCESGGKARGGEREASHLNSDSVQPWGHGGVLSLSAAHVATRLPWVQGARVDGSGAAPWQEVMFRRLRGEYASLESGSRTLDSEDVLGISPMTYFYVGRTIPRFGHFVVCANGHLPEVCLTTEVAPFDSGALAQNWLVTAPPYGPDGKAELVTRSSLGAHDYEASMDPWLDAAFDSVAEYVDGVRPRYAAVPEVLLDISPGDSSIWTWEARLPTQDYRSAPVAPERIFFKSGLLERYLDWVDEEHILYDDEYADHVAMIYALGFESSTPHLDLLDYVKGTL